jgi:hypothetical protein
MRYAARSASSSRRRRRRVAERDGRFNRQDGAGRPRARSREPVWTSDLRANICRIQDGTHEATGAEVPELGRRPRGRRPSARHARRPRRSAERHPPHSGPRDPAVPGSRLEPALSPLLPRDRGRVRGDQWPRRLPRGPLLGARKPPAPRGRGTRRARSRARRAGAVDPDRQGLEPRHGQARGGVHRALPRARAPHAGGGATRAVLRAPELPPPRAPARRAGREGLARPVLLGNVLRRLARSRAGAACGIHLAGRSVAPHDRLAATRAPGDARGARPPRRERRS